MYIRTYSLQSNDDLLGSFSCMFSAYMFVKVGHFVSHDYNEYTIRFAYRTFQVACLKQNTHIHKITNQISSVFIISMQQ